MPDDQRPWPLWAVLMLFAVAVVAVPLTTHFRKQPAPPLHDLTDLAERLRAAHSEWHVIQVTGTRDGLEAGFWVCDREPPLLELLRLNRTWEDGPRWRGVVLCRREKNSCVNYWGEYGVRVKDFSLFGDPQMVRQIAPLLPW